MKVLLGSDGSGLRQTRFSQFRSTFLFPTRPSTINGVKA